MRKVNWLSTEQVAAMLGVTQRRVIALITAGRLPAQKFSGVYLIDPKDVEQVRVRKTGRPPKKEAKKNEPA